MFVQVYAKLPPLRLTLHSFNVPQCLIIMLFYTMKFLQWHYLAKVGVDYSPECYYIIRYIIWDWWSVIFLYVTHHHHHHHNHNHHHHHHTNHSKFQWDVRLNQKHRNTSVPWPYTLRYWNRDKLVAFADIYTNIFLNENRCDFSQLSFKFVPVDPFDKKSALVQIMAWRQKGDQS